MTVFTSILRTVYFARPIGATGPVKIGCTNNVGARLQRLRPVAGGELELLATIPGSMDDEFRIQSLFWHDRIGGEWFKWSRGLQLVINAAARGELDMDALPPFRVRAMPERKGLKAANAARRAANA